jgi:hypothetical protein
MALLGPFQTIVDVDWGLDWEITTQGFIFPQQAIRKFGGWVLQINFEDSANCGGINSNTQSGTARKTFRTETPVVLSLSIIGLAELQNSGFDRMEVYLNDNLIVDATSRGEGLGCQMGPPTIDFPSGSEISLGSGEYRVLVYFTTGDGLYHTGAFYQIEFNWRAA